MSAFTPAEEAFLATQRVARLATSSRTGQPDVSAVGFGLDGDDLVSGGFDLTRTIRYRHLGENPVATIVIDELASIDPWRPRGVKVRGEAIVETAADGKHSIRIHPRTIWSWGINEGAAKHFATIEKRQVD
jgi:pyridoxamine 5'-phosphate oxidase family protein